MLLHIDMQNYLHIIKAISTLKRFSFLFTYRRPELHSKLFVHRVQNSIAYLTAEMSIIFFIFFCSFCHFKRYIGRWPKIPSMDEQFTDEESQKTFHSDVLT